MYPFRTTWKHQKINGFLMISGGAKRKRWEEMDKYVQLIFFGHMINSF